MPLQIILGPPSASLQGSPVGSLATACMTCYSRLHRLSDDMGDTSVLCAGDWAQGNMWSCSEFAQHLDASCAQKGLWQNHIQPQMQRVVQYSLACATVGQAHHAYSSVWPMNAVPVQEVSAICFHSKLAWKDTSDTPIFAIASFGYKFARDV